MNRGQKDEHIASSERNFCSKCSAMLWLWDETWPELLHPFASAIDSPELQDPEEILCLKLDSKPAYVRLPEGPKKVYDGYPPSTIESWHKDHNEYVP
ncbi:hypothetical protein FA95DRAFT_1558577 [Auriscalpium vulgare]|uniref:Uncharacterized protein n=1 Tax=Auriscalpium vulgare TaxID=40419 RepID=A0ACB8RUN6_9AGAM|nr:hypothetical protein FA95DRAFT_1558577 [Auriscalpium vulgare]